MLLEKSFTLLLLLLGMRGPVEDAPRILLPKDLDNIGKLDNNEIAMASFQGAYEVMPITAFYLVLFFHC